MSISPSAQLSTIRLATSSPIAPSPMKDQSNSTLVPPASIRLAGQTSKWHRVRSKDSAIASTRARSTHNRASPARTAAGHTAACALSHAPSGNWADRLGPSHEY